MAKASKERLDLLLTRRSLAPTREKARRLIMAGEVLVNGQLATKPGSKFATNAEITLKRKPRFVSRGGEKLLGALQKFPIDLTQAICADFGASTGGFTDCMLQHGAAKVYAIDAGYGQLAWSLRQDDRVVEMERVNARYLEGLPEPVDFAVTDVSFISIRHILPVMNLVVHAAGQVVVLIKPQFEVGKGQVGKGGVVKNPVLHRDVLQKALTYTLDNEFFPAGLLPSPLVGPAGNVEFLLWATRSPDANMNQAAAVETALTDVHGVGSE